MEEIAAGKGRGPKPFMTAGAKASDPGAIWHSNRPRKPRPQRRAVATLQASTSARKTSKPSGTSMPRFIAPQLCKTLVAAAAGRDWAHEIKFDGYRMQLRIEDGVAVLRTRKGLDWTDKFQAIAKAAARLPDGIIDGEVVALDDSGAPNFAALQAALSDGRSQDLVFFVFDPLFDGGEDLRELPLSERKDRLKALLAKEQGPRQHSLRRPLCGRRRRGAAVRLPHAPGRHHLQAAQRALPLGPHRQLDQIQMPGRP